MLVPAGGGGRVGEADRRTPEPLHPDGQVLGADRNLSIPAPEPLQTGATGAGEGARPSRTITLVGARGGQGTTTVTAALACVVAADTPTVLVSS